MCKFYTLIALLLLIACEPKKGNGDDTNQNDEANLKTTTSKDSSVKADSLPTLPANLVEIKKKCKFTNLKKFDIGRKDPCDFRGYQTMTQQDLNQLKLPTKVKAKFLQNGSDKLVGKFHAYYAFQENIKGNLGVVIFSCMEGMSNELICLIYNKKGEFLGHTDLAYKGADMDMMWEKKGNFKANGQYHYQYLHYLGTSDQVCEQYTSVLNFNTSGNINPSDTAYQVKSDPKVPCYEKKFPAKKN